jgi:hypothetical protein
MSNFPCYRPVYSAERARCRISFRLIRGCAFDHRYLPETVRHKLRTRPERGQHGPAPANSLPHGQPERWPRRLLRGPAQPKNHYSLYEFR